MSATGTKLSPAALKRLQNQSKFWTERAKVATNDAELAKVCFDRAKAAARTAQRAGNPRAMHELAELLAKWAAQQEHAQARRHTA